MACVVANPEPHIVMWIKGSRFDLIQVIELPTECTGLGVLLRRTKHSDYLYRFFKCAYSVGVSPGPPYDSIEEAIAPAPMPSSNLPFEMISRLVAAFPERCKRVVADYLVMISGNL